MNYCSWLNQINVFLRCRVSSIVNGLLSAVSASRNPCRGGRGIDELKEFAAGLGPTCSPTNLELCDDEKKSKIMEYKKMGKVTSFKLIKNAINRLIAGLNLLKHVFKQRPPNANELCKCAFYEGNYAPTHDSPEVSTELAAASNLESSCHVVFNKLSSQLASSDYNPNVDEPQGVPT